MKKYRLLIVLISLILGACVEPAAPPTPWPTIEPVLFEPNGLPTPPIPTPRPTAPRPDNNPNYVKPTKAPYATDVTWNQMHDFLYLQGGLTQAGRIQLERGQSSYFIVYFSKIPDETFIQRIKAAGMQDIYAEIDERIITKVSPQALPFLEELEAQGLLNFAGPYPPRFKTSESFEEELTTFAPTEKILIKISLRDYPTDAEHAEIVYHLEVHSDTKNKFKTREEAEAFAQKARTDLSFYTITGLIEVQHISIILNSPIVEEVGPIGSPF